MKLRLDKEILILGTNGFPFGSSDSYRILQLARAFLNSDITPKVICRFGRLSQEIVKSENIKFKGIYDNISYLYTSLLPYKPNNFLGRSFFKCLGFLIEFYMIFSFKLFSKGDTILVYTTFFKKLKYYRFITKLFKLKLIYDYVEYVDALLHRDEKDILKLPKKFDYNFHKYIDACIAISPFLNNHINSINPSIPSYLLPPAVSFEKIDAIRKHNRTNQYFMYCGSAHYQTAINFILKAYDSSDAKQNNIHLLIVTYGNDKDISKIRGFVEKMNISSSVIIKTELSYSDLISFYKSAKALLMPISDSVQDVYRFPFKIAEYTACAVPIITSNIGAIKSYFTNLENAIFALPNDSNDYSNKMNYCMNKSLTKISKNSYELGYMSFNYDNQTINLKKLLEWKIK
jgi:glycosyltransferase involved in cell wall biosynthesis